MSAKKTKVYFSKNVSHSLAICVITICGYEKVSSLGKYLGVSVL